MGEGEGNIGDSIRTRHVSFCETTMGTAATRIHAAQRTNHKTCGAIKMERGKKSLHLTKGGFHLLLTFANVNNTY
jgi:hypothetical protein